MSKALLILTIIIISTGCNQNSKSTTVEGKSRSELLAKIPYRGEIINDNITNTITETIKLVIEKTESLNEVTIFYVTNKGKLVRQNGNWKNGAIALKHANELWRNIDLTMTIIAYPSHAQDAVTGETKELWTIEVDHESVSRTCRMFFDSPTPSELTKLDC